MPALSETCEQPLPCYDDFADEMTASLPSLRRFARSLCRHRDMAEDLVQETMVRAWASRHTFLPGSNFRPWLFTILRNQFYNAVRKSNRLVSWEPEAAERLLLLIAGAGMTYEEAALHADCKLGTVKSRINRGRAAMRAIIDGADAAY